MFMITSSNQYRNLRVVFGHSNSTKVGKSEVGSRKSEVGSRKSEVGSREVGSRKSEVESRKSVVKIRESLLGFRKFYSIVSSLTGWSRKTAASETTEICVAETFST